MTRGSDFESSSIRTVPSPSDSPRSTTATSTPSSEPLASDMEPACLTTMNSGSRSNMKASACRNEAWSSTSKMRARFFALFSMVFPPPISDFPPAL